jgi:hypothetical protein
MRRTLVCRHFLPLTRSVYHTPAAMLRHPAIHPEGCSLNCLVFVRCCRTRGSALILLPHDFSQGIRDVMNLFLRQFRKKRQA